jgi:SOS-response transcriptional repressor LexA
MIGLTKMQRACLDAIASYRALNGAMPSMEDLRVALALASKSQVFRLLAQLEGRHAIRRARRKSRAISIVIDKCPHCRKPLEAVQGKKS